MIDHRHADLFFGPVQGIGVGTLTGQIQHFETTDVVVLD